MQRERTAPQGQTEDRSLVYFCQAEVGGPIKIGRAQDPHERLRFLQTASPFKLRITHVMEGGAARERALHARHGVRRLYGEWFEPTTELVRVAHAIPADSGALHAAEKEAARRGWEAAAEHHLKEIRRLEERVADLTAERDMLDEMCNDAVCWRCDDELAEELGRDRLEIGDPD
jgi:hypothetical protein